MIATCAASYSVPRSPAKIARISKAHHSKHCMAVEEMSKCNAAMALSYLAHSNLCVNQIKLNGTEEQK